jgi:hypothetical protein
MKIGRRGGAAPAPPGREVEIAGALLGGPLKSSFLGTPSSAAAAMKASTSSLLWSIGSTEQRSEDFLK